LLWFRDHSGLLSDAYITICIRETSGADHVFTDQ
jgi:hypothetical protein